MNANTRKQYLKLFNHVVDLWSEATDGWSQAVADCSYLRGEVTRLEAELAEYSSIWCECDVGYRVYCPKCKQPAPAYTPTKDEVMWWFRCT